MLSLQLKSGDYLTIGDEIAVQIFQQPGGAFSVSVKAPREIPILRGKVLERSGDDRPDCLRDRAPKRPSVRARNARNMAAFAKRKEQETAAVQEMRSILARMDSMAEAGALRQEIGALRAHLETIGTARGHSAGEGNP